MFSLLAGYAVAGLVVGAVVRYAVPGRQVIGAALTGCLGVVGAVVGGLLAAALGQPRVLSFLVSAAAAVVLIYLVGGSGRQRSPRY